jgi:HD-GYP domain-containing protein (c-di-GMP phosphodiesterase class II)
MPLALFFLLLLASLGWTEPPRVIDGTLDARAWNFESGTLRLDGKWHLHKGLRLDPTDTTQEILTPVPGWWKSSIQNANQEDVATYRLHLVLPENTPRNLAIRMIRPAGVSLRISLDGIPEGTLGTFGTSPVTSIPIFTSRPFFLTVTPGHHDLVLEAAHSHYLSKGIPRPLELGTPTQVSQHELQISSFNLLLIGCLLFLWLQFGITWLLNRRNRLAGLFSLICLFSLARHATTSSCGTADLLPFLNWEGFLRIEYLTFGTIIVWIYWFSRELFPDEFHRWPLHFLQVSGCLYALFSLIAPVHIIIASVWYYQALHLAMAPYGIINLAIAIRRKRAGSMIYLAGFSVLAITVINDVLYALGIIHTGLWAPAGLLALVIALTVITSRRASQELVDHKSRIDERLYAITSSWEARHPGFEAHQKNVAEIATALGRTLEFADDELEHLYCGARIHDAGILEVPDNILLHPGELHPDQRQQIQLHAQLVEKLDDSRLGNIEASIMRHHHERWDGNGYPDHLCGEEIPLTARIVAVADHWDALNRDRPHRPAFSREEALDAMNRERGRSLDPKLVEMFLEHRLWETVRKTDGRPLPKVG